MIINSRRYRLHLIVSLSLISIYLFIFKRQSTNFQKFPKVRRPIDCAQRNASSLTLIDDERLIECIRGRHLKPVQLLTEHFDSARTWRDNAIGEAAFRWCPGEKRCFAFRYESSTQQALEQSDGVVVHAPNLFYMPARDVYKRRPQQLWSFYTLEPQRLSLCLINFRIADLDDWFNLTMTVKHPHSYFAYDMKRLDEYGEYQQAFDQTTKKQKAAAMTSKTKKKLAFWFVSNCDFAPSKRERLVHAMAEHMSIDIYGKCNHFANSRPDPCTNASNPRACLLDLYAGYKFYLSFENSNCVEYITEKYFKFYTPHVIFDVDVVPVVRGARLDDYRRLGPASNRSFVFADEFASGRELAEYLLYLDRNQTAYDEYLSWKRELVNKLERRQRLDDSGNKQARQGEHIWPLCELCEKLHDEAYLANHAHNTVINISEFYNPARDCARDFVGQTEEQLYAALKDNCFWAKYHTAS